MKGVVKHYPSDEWAFLFVRFGFLEIEDRKIEERSHSEGTKVSGQVVLLFGVAVPVHALIQSAQNAVCIGEVWSKLDNPFEKLRSLGHVALAFALYSLLKIINGL